MVILYRSHIRKSHSNLPPATEHPLQLQSRLLLRRPLQVKRPSCFDLEKWRREGREGVHMVKGAQLPQIQPDSLRYLSEENTALPRPIFRQDTVCQDQDPQVHLWVRCEIFPQRRWVAFGPYWLYTIHTDLLKPFPLVLNAGTICYDWFWSMIDFNLSTSHFQQL